MRAADSGRRLHHGDQDLSLRSWVTSVSRLLGANAGARASPYNGPPQRLDFPNCFAARYPDTFPLAWSVVERLSAAISSSVDFSPLERRSPGLKGFDWATYLRLSSIRMVLAFAAVSSRVRTGRHLLDVGAYFGNFSLMFAGGGYEVDAIDSYRSYGNALADTSRFLSESGIRRLDFEEVGFDLGGLAPSSYDAVLCMGVIEHVPHTPRLLLKAADRVLKPGGILVLDTPNLAYVYNRRKLARGETIFCPLSAQFFTEIPFEGHHREYTIGEVAWMLTQIGHQEISIETFNYSLYGLPVLQGEDLVNFREAEADPTCREVILAASRKGVADTATS